VILPGLIGPGTAPREVYFGRPASALTIRTGRLSNR